MLSGIKLLRSWVFFWGSLIVVLCHVLIWWTFESLIKPVEAEKAKIFLEALIASAEQTLQTSHYLEEGIVTRLKKIAEEIIKLPPKERDSELLENMRRQNDFRSIAIYGENGIALDASDSGIRGKKLPEEYECHSLLHGEKEDHVFGFSRGVFCESDAFGYARRLPEGGLVRIVTGVEFVLTFEKNVGLAGLVERLRRHSGVHRLDFMASNGHYLLPRSPDVPGISSGLIFRSVPLSLHGQDVGYFEVDFTDPYLQTVRETARFFFVVSGMASVALLFLVLGALKRRAEAGEKDRQIEETKRRIEGLGQVIAAVAHEMRNPLNIVALSISGLREEIGPFLGKEKLLSRIEMIDNTTRQANDLVKDLLQTTRPLVPNFSEVDLARWISELRTSFEASHPEITSEFTIRGTPDFFTDPSFLRQIVWNLLINSVQAGAGKVSCLLARSSLDLEITVADDGPGIPEEIQKNLFVPGCTTRPTGTGLGLYNCQRRCFALGGNIEVQTSPKGTIFIARIPFLNSKRMTP